MSNERRKQGFRVRYRRVSERMWGDRKFNELSAPPPTGQWLWVYLITGPHNSVFPSGFISGQAGLAEAIGWSLEDFQRCWQEVESRGMAFADWKSRVVYLPKAPEHNPPESINVVKAWRMAFDVLPDCALKEQIFQSASAYLIGLGSSWVKAFGVTYIFDTKPALQHAKTVAVFKPTAMPDVKPKPEPNGMPVQQNAFIQNRTEQNNTELREYVEHTLPHPADAASVGTIPETNAVGSGHGKSGQPVKRVRVRTRDTSPPTPEFLERWARYPRKIDRQGAWSAWKRTIKTPQDQEAFDKALGNYSRHIDQNETEERYIKHGPTFFGNWKGWVDCEQATASSPRRNGNGSHASPDGKVQGIPVWTGKMRGPEDVGIFLDGDEPKPRNPDDPFV